jgi:hypothetical protein
MMNEMHKYQSFEEFHKKLTALKRMQKYGLIFLISLNVALIVTVMDDLACLYTL